MMEIDTIIAGDCAELMAQLPDACIDLVVTSPPYDNLRTYNGFAWDFAAVSAQLWRIIKPGGVVVWVVADQTIKGSETGTSFRQALAFMALGFRLHDTMIYETDKPPMNDNRYQASFEFMFVFSKGRPSTFNAILENSIWANADRKSKTYRESNGNLKVGWDAAIGKTKERKIKGNVWYVPSGFGKSTVDDFAYNHPGVFPEAIARDHILSWSKPGDLVLDPFMGSGTTAKMAVETGRHYLGFDISPEYVELAKRRVAGARRPLLIID